MDHAFGIPQGADPTPETVEHVRAFEAELGALVRKYLPVLPAQNEEAKQTLLGLGFDEALVIIDIERNKQYQLMSKLVPSPLTYIAGRK